MHRIAVERYNNQQKQQQPATRNSRYTTLARGSSRSLTRCTATASPPLLFFFFSIPPLLLFQQDPAATRDRLSRRRRRKRNERTKLLPTRKNLACFLASCINVLNNCAFLELIALTSLISLGRAATFVRVQDVVEKVLQDSYRKIANKMVRTAATKLVCLSFIFSERSNLQSEYDR